MALKLPVISTGFYLAYRGASCCSNLDILDVSFAIIRCKSIPDPNLLKHEWNTKVHNWANSSGREARDGDLAMFWKRGQSFPACIPWKGIFLSTSKIYLTEVLSQKQRGDVSSLLALQQLPWFKSQRCSVNEEEWQLCLLEKLQMPKENEWLREESPEYKGRHCHSYNTQSWMPLTGCGHLQGTIGVWFKAWWRKGPRCNPGLFIILTSRRKRGHLHHKGLMLPTLFMFKLLLTCSQSKCLSLWAGWNRLQYFNGLEKWRCNKHFSVNNSWKNNQPSLPGSSKLPSLREQYQPLTAQLIVLCKYLTLRKICEVGAGFTSIL